MYCNLYSSYKNLQGILEVKYLCHLTFIQFLKRTQLFHGMFDSYTLTVVIFVYNCMKISWYVFLEHSSVELFHLIGFTFIAIILSMLYGFKIVQIDTKRRNLMLNVFFIAVRETTRTQTMKCKLTQFSIHPMY